MADQAQRAQAGRMTEDPDDVTLASYQAAAGIFIERTRTAPPALLAYLDRVADLVGQGHILELGSGPGRDAAYLEQRGVQVTRSDAAGAFVERLRAAGHQARQLDIRHDDLGDPYDAVLAAPNPRYPRRPHVPAFAARRRPSTTQGLVSSASHWPCWPRSTSRCWPSCPRSA
jgi:SAM-dependent methyltransferase